MHRKDLKIGERIGSRVILEQLPERKYGYVIYRVKCDCGLISDLSGTYLRCRRNSPCKRCSALQRISKGENHYAYKHGKASRGARHPIYNRWVSMRSRCNNPNDPNYKNYGGRGISVCSSWDNFDQFIKDMGMPPDTYSIERIDNDGDYRKENCKWADFTEQANNKRGCVYYLIDGMKISRTQLIKSLGITKDAFRHRMERKGIESLLQQYRELTHICVKKIL